MLHSRFPIIRDTERVCIFNADYREANIGKVELYKSAVTAVEMVGNGYNGINVLDYIIIMRML